MLNPRLKSGKRLVPISECLEEALQKAGAEKRVKSSLRLRSLKAELQTYTYSMLCVNRFKNLPPKELGW